MARRRTTEVLITGDKVDPRNRVGVSTPSTATKQKKPDGAFPEDHLKRRPRKIPKVIEAESQAGAKQASSSPLADLERELGMAPTAAKGEADAQGMLRPSAPPKAEKDINWQEIERAKKLDTDLPDYVEPTAKPQTDEQFDLSQPVTPKPVKDIAPPVEPQPKPVADIKPDASLPPSQQVETKKTSPKTPDIPSTHERSLDQHNRKLAETVVANILERMKEEAHRNRGQLGIHDIDALKGEFETETQALAKEFEKSFEAYVSARERAAWANKREYPFDRLIVKNFSHLFGDRSAGFDRVSRRMLPGFFMAMGMMLGPDVVDEKQERCKVLVEKIRVEKEDEFDWTDVYESPDKDDVVMDALVPMALHFDDFEKRREWFISLINGHLSPLTADDKDEKGWEMTPQGFNVFLSALLSDVHRELANDTKKPRMIKRYGASSMKTVLRVLKMVR